MIKNFRHKGLKKFYTSGSTAGVKADHRRRIQLILTRLDAAYQPEDMRLPGFDFHPLKGELKNAYAVTVNKNWRIVFQFEGKDVYDVDYLDYH